MNAFVIALFCFCEFIFHCHGTAAPENKSEKAWLIIRNIICTDLFFIVDDEFRIECCQISVVIIIHWLQNRDWKIIRGTKAKLITA